MSMKRLTRVLESHEILCPNCDSFLGYSGEGPHNYCGNCGWRAGGSGGSGKATGAGPKAFKVGDKVRLRGYGTAAAVHSVAGVKNIRGINIAFIKGPYGGIEVNPKEWEYA